MFLNMFQVSDFINLREFIAKLNSKLSNLFDGKYSSLSEIPTEFPPEGHTHDIVTETEPGFISSFDFDFFKNSCTPTPFIHNEEGYAWIGNAFYTPINLNGYAALCCNKLSYNVKKYSCRALATFEGPYISLFHQNIIYLDAEFTFGLGNHFHLTNNEDFVLNLYLELTDIQRYLLQFGKQLDRYLSSLSELPYIDIPLTILFQYMGEWTGNVRLGELRINDYRAEEDYCNTTTYSEAVGVDNEVFLNGKLDLTSTDEHLFADITQGNFSQNFMRYYFSNSNSLPMFAMNRYCLQFGNQDFYQILGGEQNKILIYRESVANSLQFRTVTINGFLRLTPNADPVLDGCRFYSL